MTEKRFEFRLCSDELYYFYIIDNETGEEYKYLIDDELLKLLNELAEENHFLKEKEKDMLDYLKKEYDYVYKQKMKHFDDAILVNCYELIEYHIRSMIEHLERL